MFMLDWPMKVYELYAEYISQDLFEESLDNCMQKLHMRDKMLPFLEFLIEYKIPTLIYSA